MRAANERGLSLATVEAFESPVGKGVTGVVAGRKLVIGNRRIMTEAGVDTASLDQNADQLRGEGATAIFVAIDGKAAGIIAIADPIKATTPGAIAALKDAGIRVVMLTGDNATTAKAVAHKLGIADVEAEVLPEDKGKVVARFRSQGRVVAMAGDGVNDAPALAAADVGIAMGTGTDVAMESAGVTLLKGDLNGIVRARHLSAATMGNIRQNLFFAFIYNAAGVPIAAGVLYPVLGILLSPIIAAAAMALSSVSVIANALRLKRVRAMRLRGHVHVRPHPLDRGANERLFSHQEVGDLFSNPALTADAQTAQLRAVASARIVGIAGDGDREEMAGKLAESADVVGVQIDALLQPLPLGAIGRPQDDELPPLTHMRARQQRRSRPAAAKHIDQACHGAGREKRHRPFGSVFCRAEDEVDGKRAVILSAPRQVRGRGRPARPSSSTALLPAPAVAASARTTAGPRRCLQQC